MVAKRYSISGVMRLVGLLALDMALLPLIIFMHWVPFFLFIVFALNVVLVRAFVLCRPLQARDYTFLIVGAVYFILISVLPPPTLSPAAAGILTSLIEWFSIVTDSDWLWRFVHSPWLELFMRLLAGAVGLLVAWLAGLLVERILQRQEQRTGVRIPPAVVLALQGAVIGLGLCPVAVFILVTAGRYLAVPTTVVGYAIWVTLGGGPIFGGLIGRLLGRARRPKPEGA